MKRLCIPALVLLLSTACGGVSQADFDAHVAEYEALLTQLEDWSDGMYQWGLRTGNALCDVKESNNPDTPYAAETNSYCGSGDPPLKDPPGPPDWGETM